VYLADPTKKLNEWLSAQDVADDVAVIYGLKGNYTLHVDSSLDKPAP